MSPHSQPSSDSADTFCILPWTQLQVHTTGAITPCGVFNWADPKADSPPPTVFRQPLGDIWNAEPMRQLRRDQLAGTRVPGCATCYQYEASGSQSNRQALNQSWESGWLNEGRLTLAQFKAQTNAAGCASSAGPAGLYLDVGRLCNLKCRLCSSKSSSRIAHDPVHHPWGNEWWPEFTGPDWASDPDLVRDHILQHAAELRYLQFYGGEPLLLKGVETLLQQLVDMGVAPNITLFLHTNGTTTRAPWLRLTGEFKGLELGLSLDGVGLLNDYIRYPSKWSALVENLEVFRKLPRVSLWGGVVLQAYNALSIVELLRFLDAQGLPFYVLPLVVPQYLGVSVLPLQARRLGAERLRAYAAADCRPHNREHVLGLAAWLEPPQGQVDEELLHRFMLFTNDLDTSRGQSFRKSCPELFELIEEAGFPWTDETLHARRQSLPMLAAMPT